MNIDIRKNIISNFKDVNKEEIIESISSSINDKEEITLPGLGVFFELIWQGANEDLKNTLITLLEGEIKRNQN